MTGAHTKAGRRKAERFGRRAETFAALFLRLKGFDIIARRFRANGGEVDLIGKRGRLIVFAEIKARASVDAAILAVTPKNRRRIRKAASSFLARHPHLADHDMRYDIIAVARWRLKHIPAAWRDSD